MKFEVDVSGYDLFQEDYTICIANDTGIVKGFKFKQALISLLQENWEKGLYRYPQTINRRGIFKVRIYCIIIYHLFKAIDKIKEVELVICKDFPGHQNDIKQNLRHFLEKLAGKRITSIKFERLPNTSNAHGYAYLMSKDKYNLLPTYVTLELKDIEPFLRKYEKKGKKCQGVIKTVT